MLIGGDMPIYCIAVFQSRTSTMLFSKNLKINNINNVIISTPKGLGSSCSISVKFLLKDFNVAYYVLKKGNFTTFTHFYKQNCNNGNNMYEVINR